MVESQNSGVREHREQFNSPPPLFQPLKTLKQLFSIVDSGFVISDSRFPSERRKTEEISLSPAVTCFAKLPRIKNPPRIFKAKGERR